MNMYVFIHTHTHTPVCISLVHFSPHCRSGGLKSKNFLIFHWNVIVSGLQLFCMANKLKFIHFIVQLNSCGLHFTWFAS